MKQGIVDRFKTWIDGRRRPGRKPRILLLADKRGWAFDNSARGISRELRPHFRFDINYVHEEPALDPGKYDLAYALFWGEDYLLKQGFEPDRILKGVSSHRWEDDPRYGPCTPAEMSERYLRDTAAVLCTSRRLFDIFRPFHLRVYHTPNGIDITRFRRTEERKGELVIGWAGNINDTVKGVGEVLQPACSEKFRLVLAPGGLSHAKMNRFYNGLDVLAVCSTHEGEPLTLLEAMAAGCFPVCTDVGIVPELVRDSENGIIVKERTPTAFREAFEWCEKNLGYVREAGRKNSELVVTQRSWEACAGSYKRAFVETLEYARRPRFRNDDVSADTDLKRFDQFCRCFRKWGFAQLHGITLKGRTNSYFLHEGNSVEYEGHQDLGKLPNDLIRALSKGLHFEEREDLIKYLADSPDEIALHGLYHTDYSAMSGAEQRQDMVQGLQLLGQLFPRKRVRYFIAPFNRTNEHTYIVAGELGLIVLAAEGVHLEGELHELQIEPETWYRYHHHRFYPESTFRYFDLSIEKLEEALARNAARMNCRGGK